MIYWQQSGLGLGLTCFPRFLKQVPYLEQGMPLFSMHEYAVET